MASVEVDGLNLNVTASKTNISELAKDLDTLRRALKQDVTAENLKTLGKNIGDFNKEINGMDLSKITSFATRIEALSSINKIKVPENLKKSVEELKKVFESMGDTSQMKEGVVKFLSALEPLKDFKASGVTGVSNALKNILKSIQELDIDKIAPKVQSLTTLLSPLADVIDKISSGLKSMPKSIGILESKSVGKTKVSPGDESGLANFKKFLFETPAYLQGFYNGVHKAISVVNSFKMTIAKGLSPFFNPFKNFYDTISQIDDKLKNFFNSIKRIAIYRLIRSALKEVTQGLKEGTENLYQWSKATGGDFAKAMDTISTAMLYFKNSVAAAVSPVITYFAPAIDLAIDKIVELVNVVNQFLARITGRETWTAALKYPVEYADKAAGATKKIKDNLQSFDELHVLRTDNGGSGKTELDYSKMFEERDFDEEVTSWVDEFKEAIQKGDWAGAGTLLGEQINGLIDKLKVSDIGTALANKLNNGFTFAYNLLNTVDFVGLGEGLANFCNDLISGIDAELVGKTFAKKWTAIIDTLYGFFKNFDFKEAGRKLSDFVKGWFEEIDGQRIGETLSMAIEGALDFGIEFLSDDEMIDEFVEDVVGLINGVDWYGICVKLFTFGEKIAEAIVKVIVGIFTGENIGTGSSVSFENKLSTGISNSNFGDSIGAGLASAIMKTPTDGISDAIGKILGLGLAGAVTVAEWAERPLTNTIGGIISDAIYGGHLDEEGNFEKRNWGWQEVTELLSIGELRANPLFGDDGYITQLIYGKKSDKDWTQTFSNVQTALANLVNSVKNAKKGTRRYFPEIKNDVVSNMNSISTFVNDSTKDMTTYVSDALATAQTALAANHVVVHAKVGETANSIKSGLTSALTTVNNAFTASASNAKTNIDSIKSGAIASINSLTKELGTPLSSVKSTITTAFSDTKSNVDKKVDSITSSVVKKFGTMNTDVKSKLDTCKKDWTDKFSNEKSGIAKSLTDAAKACADGITTGLSGAKAGGVKAMEGFRDGIKEPMNDVIGFSETMGKSVAKSFNKVIDSLNSIKATTPDWLPDKKLANKTWDMAISKIDTDFTIPKLATGGVVSSPTTALIGEAGREAVVPLDRNTGWMDEIAMRVSANNAEEVALLREQNSYLAEIASKEFGISPQAIFESVRKENANFMKRTGRTALVY